MEELKATIHEISPLNVSFGNVEVQSGSGGTSRHSRLTERDLPNQHPIEAITGLNEALANAGTKFTTDETLSLENGVLSVNRATELEEDNTLPITSAAVAATVGNIEVLLKTI